MSKRSSPDWRDRAAMDLLLRCLDRLGLEGRCLVMEERLPDLEPALERLGARVEGWNRRAFSGRKAGPWPPSGPFDAALLRLPPAKEELAMCLHAAASVLRPQGIMVVYGAKDEGVQSAPGLMADLFSQVQTVKVGGRCRVLVGRRQDQLAGLRASLNAWRSTWPLHLESRVVDWVSYPGVFAHGRLDGGTELLLEALPEPGQGDRVLDYGCGSGVVGRVIAGRVAEVELVLLDVDAVALEAARENVPGGRFLLRDGLPGPEEGLYDLVLSNPPFHRGKVADPSMLIHFMEGASRVTAPRGSVLFVAQARLSLEPELNRRFRRVALVAQTGAFRVWKGSGPL